MAAFTEDELAELKRRLLGDHDQQLRGYWTMWTMAPQPPDPTRVQFIGDDRALGRYLFQPQEPVRFTTLTFDDLGRWDPPSPPPMDDEELPKPLAPRPLGLPRAPRKR